MKEIKFRYIVKRKNGYVFSELFTIEQIEKGKANLFIKVNHVNPNELTREQYTGLKDKNGKEIYPGDIIQTSNHNKKWDIWEPEEMGTTVAKVVLDRGLRIEWSNWKMENTESNSVFSQRYCKIIGNIHENPELLNG